ncbi:MAG: GIY-YIG nuclease family protein [Verrucomicrobiota bacterium]
MYWVYVIENLSGMFYVGQTDDLDARLANHNRTDKTAGKFTRKHGPWQLVWSEAHPTRVSAMARERQIKAMTSARWIRANLLDGRVPTRWDLHPSHLAQFFRRETGLSPSDYRQQR